MNRTITFLLIICTTLFLTGCWYLGSRNGLEEPPLRKVWGYKPVYSADTSLLQIKTITPQPVKNAGKIFAMGNLIFQNETGMGIHVLDKTNPASIVNRGFIEIRGNTELTLKGNFLYANSFTDLVLVDITDWKAPVEVKKIKDAFRAGAQQLHNLYLPPPQHGTYYECVNYYNGVHTGWVQDSVYATCYYN